MLTVNGDRDVVERQLASGQLCCPSCGGVLGGWGNARPRRVRVLDGPDVEVVPRRSRCRGCGGTHVLLPAQFLSRRADAGAVIGRALEEKAAGSGHRVIAAGAGAAAVDGAGLAAVAGPGRGAGAGAVHGAGGGPGDRSAAARAGRVAAGGRGGGGRGVRRCGGDGAGRGQRAAVAAGGGVTCGLLLAPSWPVMAGNASWLWAAAR